VQPNISEGKGRLELWSREEGAGEMKRKTAYVLLEQGKGSEG